MHLSINRFSKYHTQVNGFVAYGQGRNYLFLTKAEMIIFLFYLPEWLCIYIDHNHTLNHNNFFLIKK